jgi:phenylacetate-coenzyme A ligase PaaK-like adenylate-forming protein
LLHKESVRNDPTQFHGGPSWLSAKANTGGTTGTPLRLTRSPQSVVAEQVCLDRMMRLLGAEPATVRMAVLRGDSIKDPSDASPPFWLYAIGGRRLILSTNHLSQATLPHYVEVLTQFAPDVLWVYPNALESLCRLLLRADLRLQVPHVLSSSEVLRPAVWELAQRVLQASIVDYYGQAERVAFAYAQQAQEYYFLPGYAKVELLRHGEDAESALYEIVGTSLWNAAMPLLRYRTGDLVRLPHGTTAQGVLEVAYGVRPFAGVIGRSQDVLLAPDGVGVLTGIDHIPRGVAHLVRLQVVQESLACVILRALVTPDFSARDGEQMLANARLKIPRGVDVRLEMVERLERTASGKTPFVIHSPAVKAALAAASFGQPN